MKKTSQKYWIEIGSSLLLAVGLLMLAKAASAGNVNGASALQKNSTNANTSGLGLQLSVGSDFNGNTSTGMTVNCTNCGGGGAGAVATTVTAIPATTWLTSTAFTALTSGVTTICLSYTAGTTKPVIPTIAALYNSGNVLLGDITTSSTPPVSLSSSNLGFPISAGASAQVWGSGAGYASGHYLHLKVSGTASVTGLLRIETLP